MKNILEQLCTTLQDTSRPVILAHTVAGYPTLEDTREILLMLQSNGAHLIEVQIPFSDPLGDGSVIREACAKSAAHGTTPHAVLQLLKDMNVRGELRVPVLIMTYFNIAFHMGMKIFCTMAAAAGVSGLIIPDYPPEAEETEHLRQIAADSNLVLIPFVSLDSSAEHIATVAKEGRGFVYCFSSRGVTGGRPPEPELKQKLELLKKEISLPLAAGFGIATPKDVSPLVGSAQIIIVGSALLRAYETGGLPRMKRLLCALKHGW